MNRRIYSCHSATIAKGSKYASPIYIPFGTDFQYIKDIRIS